MPIFLIVLTFFVSQDLWAYPEFIGYKYSSCLTCHYNGQGNGPLNDYGRALWASEIAGRMFANNRTDEQLGEASGFLGSKQLPWWIRPGVKARNIAVQSNPGAKSDTRSILMQAEVNAAIFFKQDQSFAFVGSFGQAPIPMRLKGTKEGEDTKEWISREHYFRYQWSENFWIYAGMMDKVYGLRLVNHTAFSRTRTGLSMNDQAHGMIFHYIQPTWELTFNAFGGNMYQDAELRQTGGSVMYEQDIADAWRVGASALYSSNKFVKNTRFGLHSKTGLGHGSALLFELGLIDDAPMAGESRMGYYLYSEAMQRIYRGYHFFITGQVYKDRLEGGRAENLVAGFGVLAFPMQRFEFRLEAESLRQMNNSPAVTKDGWKAMAQLHISL